ncbi:MAG: DUF3291 domain-containing protein [Bacteroidetes bacterium]|nr:DUF3291 domain-containing protein [Bacteroidota bacterium]
MRDQITSITFFRFSGLSAKVWAFRMMRDAPGMLQDVAGQSFFKLMGSGRDRGFNPMPDWNVYSLLQVWESEAAADQFFEKSPLLQDYQERSARIWTIYMRNIMSRGLWSGKNPFSESEKIQPAIQKIAVITRATIRPSRLIRFWRQVPQAQKGLRENPGLIYTKGIGEVPIIQMATFSLWEDAEALKRFAYQSKGHQKAIRQTRELNWYKEELFSRFQPYKERGDSTAFISRR